jgi:hypothetical protein
MPNCGLRFLNRRAATTCEGYHVQEPLKMDGYPFMVRVPRTQVDETTMGEWLETRNIDYVAATAYPSRAAIFEFRFSCQATAEAFARNFIGIARTAVV